MNAEQFIECLEQPEKLDASSVIRFNEVIREYPFCQPAQLLYLKSLQNDENIRFNRQLKIAALYANDRRSLFELLHVSKEQIEGYSAQESPQPEQFSPQPKLVSPHLEKPLQNLVESPPLSTPVSGEKAGTHLHRESDPGDDYPRSELVKQVESLLPIKDLDLLLFDFPIARNDERPDPEAQRRTPQYHPGWPEESPELTEDASGRDLISEFLLLDPLSRHRTQEPVVYPKTMNRPPVEADSPIVFEKQRKEADPAKPRKPGSDLIDNFINQAGSRILRPDHEYSSGDDRSLDSLREDEEILTETLAKIFVQQGYFLKAIHSYEKLSLKFPEKSVYFASQIISVRELIKNQ